MNSIPKWQRLSVGILAPAFCVGLMLGSGRVCSADAAQPADPAKKDAAQAAPAPAAPAAQAAPAAPAGPKPGDISYSGLADWYFGLNTRGPHPQTALGADGGHFNIDNVGRSFDVNTSVPSFSLGEFNISRTAGKGFPLGFTATLTAGDTAKLVHLNEPGGTAGWSPFQQLYVTYTPHLAGRDIPIDAGIWVTPFGLEVIESSSNDNYSRGLLFQYAIPLYHAGLRATVPVTSTLSFVGGLVNGWNNIADDNTAKSVLGQFTWKPNAKVTGVFGFMSGAEGTGAYGVGLAPVGKGDLETLLFDGNVVYTPTAKLKLSLAGDYGSGAGSVGATHMSGSWDGIAVIGRYQWTPKFATALRLEQFEDTAGVGGVGLRTGLTGNSKLQSLTLTAEYPILHDHLLSRLEYRHDHASKDYFSAGSGFGTDQDTFTFSQVYKF